MSERLEEKKAHTVHVIGLTQLPDVVLKHIGCFCDERTLQALCCTCVKLKIVYSVALATRAANRIEQSTTAAATKPAPNTFVSPFYPFLFDKRLCISAVSVRANQPQGERDSAHSVKVGTQAGLPHALKEVLVSAQLVTVCIARRCSTGPCVPARDTGSRER